MARPTRASPSARNPGSGTYCPDEGDVIWIDLDPQAGHEQAGRRPALVITPQAYNAATGLCIACPVTNQAKGYPFEVTFPEGSGATGVVLSDHLKSLDWATRRATLLVQAPQPVLAEVRAKMKALLRT